MYKLSGRMPDSQSRDPRFESPLLPFQSLGIFVLHDGSDFEENNKTMSMLIFTYLCYHYL